MNDLVGGGAELAFTVSVTRKETGLVEEYQMVAHVTDEQLEELKNGNDTLDSK